MVLLRIIKEIRLLHLDDRAKKFLHCIIAPATGCSEKEKMEQVAMPEKNSCPNRNGARLKSFPLKVCMCPHGAIVKKDHSMRKRLLLSTAALLAGVAIASAQTMQGEQRGGAAAQDQKSQSSPQQGQSQQAPQGKQQGQSQRGQKGETTGQAPQSQREPGAQQGKEGQSQQRSQGQKQREQTTGQTPQRQEGQQGQTGQAPQQGQAQQGQAGSSANLTTEQRTQIRQTVLTGSNVPRANNVNFALSVGTTVPTRVRVVAVPPRLIEIHPAWRGHMYFVVGDQIIIVDRRHRIIAIINV
jgi:hypothetical protein